MMFHGAVKRCSRHCTAQTGNARLLSLCSSLRAAGTMGSTSGAITGRSMSSDDTKLSAQPPMQMQTQTQTQTQQKQQGYRAHSHPPSELPYRHFHKKNPAPPSGTPFLKPPKFESPRKRANKMFRTVVHEAISRSKAASPKVHGTHFRVGDAIELSVVSGGGGVNSTKPLDKVRGVVLGRTNRGLGSGVYLRDVVMGEPINRKIPLHSPLVKEVKLLQDNFVFKGKRKIKRAKLYYLRDRLPQETRVTKV